MMEARKDFEYIGGAPPIDFVNTVGWARSGLRNERFREYGDLVDWAREGKLISAIKAAALRRQARTRPDAARRELLRARRVRSQLQRLLATIRRRRGVSRAELRKFNALLARATRDLTIAPGKQNFLWRVEGSKPALSSIVDEVIWRAAQFLTSDDPKLLGACANQDCGWMFLDRSRRTNRRWCAMDECGSRAKARRYYRRKRRLRAVSPQSRK